MAFTAILRKSASSLGPLAGRLVGGQRNYHSALFTAINHANFSRRPSLRSRLFPSLQALHYSSAEKRTSADETLIEVINKDIEFLRQADDHDRVEMIPSGFPFEIEDNPGLQTVTLKRTYQGEEIEVEVNMPYLVTGEDNDDHDVDGEKVNQSSLPLVVSVSKKSAPSLEFGCTAYPDEVVIDSLSVKRPEVSEEDDVAYGGPDFHDLDENLQKAFHKYLEIRGIKPSAINFLHEYMINKNSREELNWLKKLKNFVEA